MSKKLLLADDSITIQKVIGITFANEDFEMIITDNGDAALEKVRSERPDLILADVYMPGKNGYELCSTVKQDQGLKHIPVLLLTGTFEPFDEAKAKSVGADGWIAKPFESQALITKVDELLSKAPAAMPIPESPQAPEPPTPPPATETAAETPAADIWSDMGDIEFEPETPAATAEQSVQAPVEKAWEEGLISQEKESDDEDLWGSVSFDEEDLGEDDTAPTTSDTGIPGSEEEMEVFGLENADNAPDAGLSSTEEKSETALDEEETFEFDEEPVLEEEPGPVKEEAGIEFDEDAFEFDDEPAAEETESVAPDEEATRVELEEDVFEFEEEKEEETPESLSVSEETGEVEFEMEDFEFEEEPVPVEAQPTGAEASAEAEVAFPPFDEVETEGAEEEEDILSLEDVEILEEEDLETGPGETPLTEEEDIEPAPPMTEEVSDELPHPEYQHAAGEGEWGFEEPLPAAELPSEEVASEPSEPEPPAEPAVAAAAVEDQAAGLTEADLEKVVEKVAGQVIERLAGTLLEKIAWEVVPDLAESMIREEISKIKDAAQ